MLAKFLRLFFRPIWTMTLLLLLSTSATYAAPRFSVTLTYFRGEINPDGARLEWQTATELDTAGFRIWRATSASGPYSDLTEIGVVPAQGSATSGSTYETLDATAASGNTYWYKLIEMEYDGSENELQIISLTIDAAPTATVEGIATADGDGATPAPTDDAATNVPAPSATNTLAPTAATNTPRATTTDAPADPTATASQETVPADSTAVRPSGDAIAEAAGVSPTAQPRAIAQATEGYPGTAATDVAPGDAYPGADDVVATPTPEPTADGYPSGMPVTNTQTGPEGIFEDTVGDMVEGGEADAGQSQEPSALSRVLLWIGFGAALLIFIGGVVFSILISTRKQR